MIADKKEVLEKMDEAAEDFAADFRSLISNLTYEEISAIARVIDLMSKHRDTAGYKRMFQHLLSFARSHGSVPRQRR